MRSFLLLLTGLAAGVAGAILIRDSVLPDAGTPEARILELENELRETRLQLAKIDPAQARSREDAAGSLRAGIREAMEDLKAGRPVDLGNMYRAVRPLAKTMIPIFDRIRRKEERRQFEHLAGEMRRKYNLSAAQQEALKQWLEDRSNKNADRFNETAFREGATLDDFVKASKDARPDEGIDAFMEGQLQGAELKQFQQDRLVERAERVQHEADWKVERLSGVVDLDENQKDQVFSIMARGSRDFDPRMQIEGVSAETTPDGRFDRNEAMMQVLRPEQRVTYEEWRLQRVREKQAEFAEVGLKLPDGFEAIDDY